MGSADNGPPGRKTKGWFIRPREHWADGKGSERRKEQEEEEEKEEEKKVEGEEEEWHSVLHCGWTHIW